MSSVGAILSFQLCFESSVFGLTSARQSMLGLLHEPGWVLDARLSEPTRARWFLLGGHESFSTALPGSTMGPSYRAIRTHA
jgi:hypothetical protein